MQLETIATTVSIFGMCATVIGAYIAARALILTEDQAIHIGLARFASDKREENLKLPLVQSLLSQSRHAKWGLYLVSFGTALQIVGALMPGGVNVK